MKYVRLLFAAPGLLLAAVGHIWITLIIVLIGSDKGKSEYFNALAAVGELFHTLNTNKDKQ